MNKFDNQIYRADIEKLLEIMAALRNPESGCPWDIEQDFGSIAPYTIEEAYEVADAIERGDIRELREELGDLLLQVVFHAQMAREQGLFEFTDVVDAICDKLVRRHPHVFGDTRIDSAAAQTEAWEAHKARERSESGDSQCSALDGVPVALPALTRALKLGRKAARQGFDWPDTKGVRNKIREELEELETELDDNGEQARIEAELGDLLFAVANLARHLGLDPEAALRSTNARFETRFRYLEQRLADAGIAISDSSLEEMEALWQEAKEAVRDR